MMKTVQLGDVAVYVNEKIGVNQLKIEDYVSTENMLPNKAGMGTATKMPASGKVTKYKIEDVLVSNIRPYFKKIWFADKSGGASNDVLVFRPKVGNLIPRYLKYILADDKFFAFSTASSSGAKMPRGDKAQIMKYPVYLPDPNLQKKIADILGTIDEKIELNRKMNETLEQIGQTLFRHYFIDNPKKERWQEVEIDNLFEIIMGQSPPGSSYNALREGIVFYQGRTEFGLRFPTERLYTTGPKRYAKKGDTLLSVRAPVGDINQALQNCCIGRGLAAISSRNGMNSFCYYACRGLLQHRLLEFNSEGTVFGAINAKQLKSLKTKRPPEILMNEFEASASVIDSQILCSFQEIQTLTTLRDTLLPKLVSGKVKLD